MKILKLISDSVVFGDKRLVYNRRLVKSFSSRTKTAHKIYLEKNISQFYDFINPDIEVK